jgi:HSP20 family molecular chaperone IbpA
MYYEFIYSGVRSFGLPIKYVESEDKYVINIDLMGIDPKDCEVVVEEKRLSIGISPNKYKIYGDLKKEFQFIEFIDIDKSKVEINDDKLKIIVYKNKSTSKRKVLHPT